MLIFFKEVLLNIVEKFFGKHSSENIYDFALTKAFNHLDDLFSTIAYRLVGIIIFIVGFTFTYFNLLNQYDSIENVKFGAVASGGIVLIFIGFGIIYNSKKDEKSSIKENITSLEANKTKPSQMEEALAALIMDIIKEREINREASAKNELKQKTDRSDNEYFPDEINLH